MTSSSTSTSTSTTTTTPIPTPTPNNSLIPVGIIGYSNSARTFHLPLIQSLPSLFQLHSIQQRSTSTSRDCRSDFPSISKHETVDSLLSDLPRGSLVIITTTNVTHFDFAQKALQSNHHVVVEKPLALKSDQIKELKALADEKGLVCSAYQNRRWDGDFLTIRSLISQNNGSGHDDGKGISALGIPTYLESRFDRFRPFAKGGWREETKREDGGGMLWDLGSHLIDQVISLFGPPESVQASISSTRPPFTLDDDFHLLLTYPSTHNSFPSTSPLTKLSPSGLRVHLGASVTSPHVDSEQLRFRIQGTRGSYVKLGLDPQENQLKAGWKPIDKKDSFGFYADDEIDDLKLGRVTTTVKDGHESKASENNPSSSSSSAPVQPELKSSRIPTLPGNYLGFYENIARSILVSKDEIRKNGEKIATREIEKVQAVKMSETEMVTKVIEMAWQSQIEGKKIYWKES